MHMVGQAVVKWVDKWWGILEVVETGMLLGMLGQRLSDLCQMS